MSYKQKKTGASVIFHRDIISMSSVQDITYQKPPRIVIQILVTSEGLVV